MGLKKLQVGKEKKSSSPADPAGTVTVETARSGVPMGTWKNLTTEVILANSDVKLSVLKYNEEGSLYGSLFPAGDMRVIHCFHEQKPSVFFQFGKKVGPVHCLPTWRGRKLS